MTLEAYPGLIPDLRSSVDTASYQTQKTPERQTGGVQGSGRLHGGRSTARASYKKVAAAGGFVLRLSFLQQARLKHLLLKSNCRPRRLLCYI